MQAKTKLPRHWNGFRSVGIRAYVKTQIAGVAEDRSKLVSELNAAKDSLALVADAWASPTALLMRQTLGSEKRSTYTSNLANAGP